MRTFPKRLAEELAFAGVLVDSDDYQGGDDMLRMRSYSGRGMYGENCIGFEGNHTQLARLFYELGQIVANVHNETPDGTDEIMMFNVESFIDCLSQDSMGYDLIFYFRGWELG